MSFNTTGLNFDVSFSIVFISTFLVIVGSIVVIKEIGFPCLDEFPLNCKGFLESISVS